MFWIQSAPVCCTIHVQYVVLFLCIYCSTHFQQFLQGILRCIDYYSKHGSGIVRTKWQSIGQKSWLINFYYVCEGVCACLETRLRQQVVVSQLCQEYVWLFNARNIRLLLVEERQQLLIRQKLNLPVDLHEFKDLEHNALKNRFKQLYNSTKIVQQLTKAVLK